jgi:diacylglycerol kinase family enzyme
MDPDAATASARGTPFPAGARALLLVNEMAGGVGAGDADKLAAALADAGVGEYALISAERMSRALFARAADFDVIVLLGGDGTARAAAELAPRDGPPLILLPGGTLNILPRALYGDLAWPEALAAALERGEVTRLTAGRANGEPFYVAALFGAPTLLARAREAMREGQHLRAWRRLGAALQRLFLHRLRARPDRAPMRKAEAIGVLCPAFSGGIRADDLEWVRLDANHLLDLARVGLRALTAAWRTDPSIEITRCRTSDIVSPGVIPATLDGEPRTYVSRVRVTHEPRGPRVIALPQED